MRWQESAVIDRWLRRVDVWRRRRLRCRRTLWRDRSNSDQRPSPTSSTHSTSPSCTCPCLRPPSTGAPAASMQLTRTQNNVTNEWSDTVALDHVFASVLSRHLFWVGGAWRGVTPRVKIRLLPKNIPLRPVALNGMRKLATPATKSCQFLQAKLPGPSTAWLLAFMQKCATVFLQRKVFKFWRLCPQTYCHRSGNKAHCGTAHTPKISTLTISS